MIETDRLIAPEPAGNTDEQIDRAIRPKTLDDYLGQRVVREQMEIFLAAAKGRGEPLDHTLIFGPPGLGKTTLATIIAHEMGVSLKTTSGPVLEKAGDIAALMTNLEPGDVLFIDEIHRLSPFVEEVLYPAMEDYQLDIMIGEGPLLALSSSTYRRLRWLAPPPEPGYSRHRYVTALALCSGWSFTRSMILRALFRDRRSYWRFLWMRREPTRLPGALAVRPALLTGYYAGCEIMRRFAPMVALRPVWRNRRLICSM